MIELINNYETLSIIGTAKNVGKTTTLNYLLKRLYKKKRIGLTSIGRDGESVDVVTHTKKPKIYVEAGTVVATAKQCLLKSDFTKQILETTSIFTPLGEIIIARALSEGFVDLAGPSMNSQTRVIIERMKKYKVDLVLIDGAISRKSMADQYISDATILCTGASYSSNINKVINDTAYFVNMLTLPKLKVDHLKIEEIIRTLIEETTVSIISCDGSVKKLPITTSLNKALYITSELDVDSRYLIIRGALSKQLLESLVAKRDCFKQLTIVIKNGTKCFFDTETYNRLIKSNIDLRVINPTNLIAITYNPTSPYHYQFNEKLFRNELQEVINIPVYNVIREASD
ncbi:lysine 5,6-aminomutase reactivase subunit KamB [Haloplasma contractile]|uniref:Uncharacterized protein n=1 Tax=Haloplasma contractile SSD-17B TaxID=1033810 RepID=F7Q0I9_9MOLU|nr:hypothetical protein [Haloplasma contractile]ERJ12666.1 hypothetical protein HLPCO_001006 [Haloplasma contractile SSD-17B]